MSSMRGGSGDRVDHPHHLTGAAPGEAEAAAAVAVVVDDTAPVHGYVLHPYARPAGPDTDAVTEHAGMLETGAMTRHPYAKPFGNWPGGQGVPSSWVIHSGGSGPLTGSVPRAASRPSSSFTPVSGSPASTRRAARVSRLHFERC